MEDASYEELLQMMLFDNQFRETSFFVGSKENTKKAAIIFAASLNIIQINNDKGKGRDRRWQSLVLAIFFTNAGMILLLLAS